MTFEIREDLRGFFITRRAKREEEYVDKNLRLIFKSKRTTIGI